MPSVVDILINARWRGRSATRRAQQDLRGMSNTAAATSEELATTGEVSQRTGRNFTSLATKIGAATIAFGTIAVGARRAYAAIEEGAGLELTEQRFDRLAQSVGSTADVLLTDLRAATSGMLSDAQAMALATDLIGLGLADTSDKAVRLARVVAELDADMNELTLAITNQTTRRFDQLGVRVEGFDDRLERLKLTMSDEEAFTMAFLEQAEAQIETVGGAAQTTAGDLRRLQSDWDNLSDALKRRLAREVGPFVAEASGRAGQELREQAQASADAADSTTDLLVAFRQLNAEADELRQRDPASFALFVADDYRRASGIILQQLALITGSQEEFAQEAERIFGTRLRQVLDDFADQGVDTTDTWFRMARAADTAGVPFEEFVRMMDELDIPADEVDEFATSLQDAEAADRKFISSTQETVEVLADLDEILEEVNRSLDVHAEALARAEAFESRREGIDAGDLVSRQNQQQLEEEFELQRSRIDLFLDFQSDLNDITAREEERRAEVTEQFEERRTQIVADHNARRAQQDAQLARDIADVRESSAERQADLREEAGRRIEDLEEDHLDRMADIIANADIQLEEAASRLDASAVASIKRQRDRALAEEEERFQTQRERIQEQLEFRLQAEREAEEQRIAELEAHHERRQEEEQRAHDEELRQLEQQKQKRLQQIRQQAREERQARTRQYTVERNQLGQHWEARFILEGDWMDDILAQEEAWWAQRLALVGGGTADNIPGNTDIPGETDDPDDPDGSTGNQPSRSWLERTAMDVANPTSVSEVGAWRQFFDTLNDAQLARWIEDNSNIDVPGYRHGIGRVPRDMLALLHEDEAVLNQQQAAAWRAMGGMSGPSISASPSISAGQRAFRMGDVNITVNEARRPGETGQEVRHEVEKVLDEFWNNVDGTQ